MDILKLDIKLINGGMIPEYKTERGNGGFGHTGIKG